jgi:hypothetical protein
MAVRLSALGAGRSLPLERFLVLICVRSWVDSRATAAAGRIRSMEESNDLIGNRTRLNQLRYHTHTTVRQGRIWCVVRIRLRFKCPFTWKMSRNSELFNWTVCRPYTACNRKNLVDTCRHGPIKSILFVAVFSGSCNCHFHNSAWKSRRDAFGPCDYGGPWVSLQARCAVSVISGQTSPPSA